MFGAILLVIIKGTIDVGGLGVVWQRNLESGRIVVPTMTMDPTERLSMFSIFAGSTFFYVQGIACDQISLQRFHSLPGPKEAKRALVNFIIGIILIYSVCIYNGLLIFATYHDCDPLSTKLAKAKDQLVPLLVMDILRAIPGMAGLFVAGVFSAALSSLSTGLNSLSAVFLEDYIKPMRKSPLTEQQTAIVMRLTVVLIGALCLSMVFVVERMGTVLQLAITMTSTVSGPVLGLFVMGCMLPWINGKSALTGSIISSSIMIWICIQGQLATAAGELVHAEKPRTTEGCSYDFEKIISITQANSSIVKDSSKTFVEYFYHMSFFFYVSMGACLNLLFSSLASLVYGRNVPSEMDLKLFSPIIHKYIKPIRYASVAENEPITIVGLDVKNDLKSMTWDPTVRLSMFSIFVGATLFYVQCTACNQVIMQRYLSVPGLKEAKRCMIYFIIGVCLLLGTCMYNGLLIFATYHDCDPLSTKLAKAKDQLVPLLVMDILRVFPGVAGLFVAGVFSAALSSLSTGLNSLSAVFLEDYIKPIRKTPLTERQTAIIMRLSVVLMGVLCVALVFVVERMGTAVLQLSITISSVTSGPLFGLFVMGLLLPWINSKSALVGSIASFVIMTIICIQGQLAVAAGELVHPEKFLTTQGCTYDFIELTTQANRTVIAEGSKTFMQYIYHMSFLFYVTVGAFLSIIFAGLSSLVFGINDPAKMDLRLFSPFLSKFIKPIEYSSVLQHEETANTKYQMNDISKL